jgi:prolipoprotein diacylglyceryltransferase
MLPILQIGPLALRTSGLLLLLGAYLGLSLAERRLPKGGPTSDQLYNLVLLSLAVGAAAARLAFAIQNFHIFRDAPLNIFSLDAGLLDPFAGFAAALIAALAYGQRKKLAFWPTLDAFAPMLAVLAVFAGLAHIASGAAFGAPTSLPWGIELWGAKRHPSQFYETAAAAAILAWLWRRFGKDPLPGRLFLLFVTASAGARLLLEAWRGDSALLPGGLRLAQVAAWGAMAAGLWLLNRQARNAGKGSQD